MQSFSDMIKKCETGDSPKAQKKKVVMDMRPSAMRKRQYGEEAPPKIEIKEEAPESPDPVNHHRSKLVYGISPGIKEASKAAQEREFARLRNNYLAAKAEDQLRYVKYGTEKKEINYNEFLK